jgi:glucose-1-phosphate cytidylyltransferase
MKVVILAGGFGTRLSEYTNLVPKPMVKLNNKPIIYYIMKHFSNYGFDDFYIALGYKIKYM